MQAVLCATASVALLAGSAIAANDDNVQWNGLSHVVTQDLRPLVPMAGDDVTVRFQAFKNDLTAANVHRMADGATTVHAAQIVGQHGYYDIWEATLPAAAASEMSYYIEAIDGSSTAFVAADAQRPQDWQVLAAAPTTASPFELNFDTLEHAPVGSTPVEGGAVFKVWAPTRATAAVRGEFNGWNQSALTKQGEHFIGFVPSAAAGDMYKFFFNGQVWNTDPNAAQLVANDNNNAVITDPLAYDWQTPDFVAAPTDQWVIYQLHVGTFAGRNDPAGFAPNPSRYIDVANRADHLADLGVNAVMVNPINEFPGDFSGGYNPISMFAWEWKLGTPDDLKFMIDELHERGIAVVLDTVWNHFDSGANFLWNYDGSQTYFDSPVQDTPWGAQADFDTKGVFDYFLDSIHHTLGQFSFDGYRHDAVMAMTDSGWTDQWPSGQALVREMNDLVNRRYGDSIAIAEIYIDNQWVTNAAPSGIGFDAQYHNEFKEAVRAATFGSTPDIGRVARVMDGSGFGVDGTSVLNYFELHDDAWPLNGHERAIKEIDPSAPHDSDFARGRVMLANGLTLVSRGIPAILQGTEWLEDSGWENFKIDWRHKITYSGVFSYYQDLIALRTSEPSLFANAPMRIAHQNEGADVFTMHRTSDQGRDLIVIANYSNNDYSSYQVGLPESGSWQRLLSSQDASYDGSGYGDAVAIEADGSALHGFAQSATVQIPARSLLILAPADPCLADINGDGIVESGDIQTFVNLFLSQSPAADFNGDGFVETADISAFVEAFLVGC